MLPHHELKVYSKDVPPPAEAAKMFAHQLAGTASLLAPDREHLDTPHDDCQFTLICAVAPGGRVLGGVYLEIVAMGGAGPLADKKLAYLERTLVRPKYRRRGVGTILLRRAIQVASEAGCEYIRCSNNWDNVAETALFRRCGFALVDLDGEVDAEPCYLAVRPLHNLPDSVRGSSQLAPQE